MEFKNEVHAEAYERVKGLLTQLYGESLIVKEDGPWFRLRYGSSAANIAVVPVGDTRVVVDVRAYVVLGVELTADLTEYLLRENDRFTFGGFGIDRDGDVFFSHTILANDLDKSELQATIAAVASTADHYDDEIKQRWGGQRITDD